MTAMMRVLRSTKGRGLLSSKVSNFVCVRHRSHLLGYPRIDGTAVASQLLSGEDAAFGVRRESKRRSSGLETARTAGRYLDLISGTVLLKATSVACRISDDAAVWGVRAAEMFCGRGGISGLCR
jgi:hypothetical protein